MFYDPENCRGFKLLCEASSFLEASLENLLALEKEALAERDKELKAKKEENASESSGRNKGSPQVSESRINLNLEMFQDEEGNENICNCESESCEHRCAYISNKIKLSQVSVNKTEHPVKRKHDPAELNDLHEEKKPKTMLTESDGNHLNGQSLRNVDSSEERSADIVDLNSSPLNGIKTQSIECQKESDPPPEEIHWVDQYYKVLIRFREKLQYEEVEQLLKSVGLDDVFDLVLTLKKAEVTFLNESSMKKALALPQSALNQLKAYAVLPLTK